MRLVLVLVSVVLGASIAQARISKASFVKQCANLVAPGAGLKMQCSATSASGESALRRYGFQTSYVVDLSRDSKVKVNNWGFPGNLHNNTVSYVVKASFWGDKTVDFNCFETKSGSVRLGRGAAVSVTGKDRVDHAETIALSCEAL